MPKRHFYSNYNLYALLAICCLFLFYNLYLEKIEKKGSCDQGNTNECFESIKQKKDRLSSLAKKIEIESRMCKTVNELFCLGSAEAMVQLLQTQTELEILYTKLPCKIETPIMFLREACFHKSKIAESNEINEEINKNLGTACQENSTLTPEIGNSCQNAIQFVRSHPDFSSNILNLLTKACNLGILATCEEALTKNLMNNQIEQASANFKTLFLAKNSILDSFEHNCRVESKFKELSERELSNFEIELIRTDRSPSKLADLARNAFIFDCRDSKARLALAVAESINNRLDQSLKILKKLPDGQTQFLENKNLDKLRDFCKRSPSISDSWCVQLKKNGHIDPKEVKKKLTGVIVEIEFAILNESTKHFLSSIHPSLGFKFFAQDDDSDIKRNSFDFIAFNSTNLKSIKLVRSFFKSAREYLKKGNPDFFSLQNADGKLVLSVIYRIFEGHHVGNYRGLQLDFEKFNSRWYVVSGSFPSDFTP